MIACAPSEDSDQLAHPRCLIRVFVEHSACSQGPKVYSGGQRRQQADLSLRRTQMQSCRKCCIPAQITIQDSKDVTSLFIFLQGL